MTEADLKMLTDYFDRLRIECNTPEKALAQLPHHVEHTCMKNPGPP